MNIFDHLLTPSPPLQNDNGSEHFYQFLEVLLVNEVEWTSNKYSYINIIHAAS